MKNIHLLPTDKPSRLGYLTKKGKEVFKDLRLFDKPMPNILDSENQHIYITSDEEIKVGEYVIDLENNEIFISLGKMGVNNYIKKIILTTDEALIANGVQAIDDEFLEWFVKNPSCESIEVKHFGTCCGNQSITQCINCKKYNPVYKIIISREEAILAKWDRLNKELDDALESAFGPEEPKYSEDEFETQSRIINKVWDEEAKQETLEEAAENYSQGWGENDDVKSFIAGAEWQAKRMYSEEEVKNIAVDFFYYWWNAKGNNTEEGFDKWFEQFKKKELTFKSE